MSNKLFEVFKLLEKSSSDLFRKHMKNCTAEVDENGVVHLVNENGQVVMMMIQTDYEALVKYKVEWFNESELQ